MYIFEAGAAFTTLYPDIKMLIKMEDIKVLREWKVEHFEVHFSGRNFLSPLPLKEESGGILLCSYSE
jgi:hypothetical protein